MIYILSSDGIHLVECSFVSQAIKLNMVLF